MGLRCRTRDARRAHHHIRVLRAVAQRVVHEHDRQHGLGDGRGTNADAGVVAAGGGDFYARVYDAERPEIFFKNTAHRVAGHGEKVRIRRDSSWNVPEPELTLLVTSSGKIAGYTIGNDMSSRSIEGENPLYLPQAKSYDRSASVGPCIFVTHDPLPPETEIRIAILRRQVTVFEGGVTVNKIRRSLEELVSFLYRETSFPQGCLFMTGTGVVPPNDFTLSPGDVISITIDPIGALINTVE